MSGKPSLSQEAHSEIVSRYSAGEDLEPLAAHFGVCRDTVLRVLISNAIPIRKKAGGHKQTPLEVEQEILEAYEAGKGATTIGKCFGVDKATVYNVLRRHGKGRRPRGATRHHLEYARKGRITPRDLEISKLFKDVPSLVEIGKILNISDQTVRYSLRKQGLFKPEGADWSGETLPIPAPKRPFPHPKEITLREDAFDGSPEAMYWAGFLMADGCIHKSVDRPSYRLFVRLAENDICALERLKSWLNANNQIAVHDIKENGPFKKRRQVVMVLTSNKLCESLMALGVTPAKSLTATAHESCVDSVHFWRGMIDGDGCVYPPAKPTIYLSGSKPLTLQFIDFVIKNIPAATPYHRFHKSWCGVDGCWVARVSKRESVASLASLLYDNDAWSLPRKKSIAMRYFQK